MIQLCFFNSSETAVPAEQKLSTFCFWCDPSTFLHILSLACLNSISKGSNQKCKEYELNQAKNLLPVAHSQTVLSWLFQCFFSVEQTRKVIVILIEDVIMRRIMGDAPVSNWIIYTDLESGWKVEGDTSLIRKSGYCDYDLACSKLEHPKPVLDCRGMMLLNKPKQCIGFGNRKASLFTAVIWSYHDCANERTTTMLLA